MFATELEMSVKFDDFLAKKVKKNNKKIDYTFEVDGIVGIPDCILFEKTDKNLKVIVTFELKLKDWKRAFQQSMKSKLYSNFSFVVISKQGINAAKKNIDYFKKAGIGLAEFSKSQKMIIHYMPQYDIPISDLYVSLLYVQLIKIKKIENSTKNIKLYKDKQRAKRIVNILSEFIIKVEE